MDVVLHCFFLVLGCLPFKAIFHFSTVLDDWVDGWVDAGWVAAWSVGGWVAGWAAE